MRPCVVRFVAGAEARDNGAVIHPRRGAAVIDFLHPIDALRRLTAGLQWGRRRSPRVVLCGCDARHYGWLRTLGATHEVVAMVTEAPWQHATRVEGVRLYYPSEVFSLCHRFEVDYLVYATPAERSAIERAAPAAHVWQARWCHGIEGLLTP